jgi:hypothetical protein
MIKGAVAGVLGLGLIGGTGAVVYDDGGSANVTITSESGREQSVRLFTDDRTGKSYSCPPGTHDKLSPIDIRAGRIKLTIRQVRRQRRSVRREIRELDARYPDNVASGSVVDRYNGLVDRYNGLGTRGKRLTSAFNRSVDAHNDVLKTECDPPGQ